MDEQNCAKEYKGIEGNVSRDSIHLEMVVPEEFVLPQNITSTSMRFENMLGMHHWVSLLLYNATFSDYFCASALVAGSFPFILTHLIFILLFSYVFLIL